MSEVCMRTKTVSYLRGFFSPAVINSVLVNLNGNLDVNETSSITRCPFLNKKRFKMERLKY